MNIPLNQIDQFIDGTILKRGLSYYRNGYVHKPEEIKPGEYEAIVEGTEDYNVELTIDNGFITEYNCDCPYDMGPLCKHIAAVIYYIQNGEPEAIANKKNTIKDKSEAIKPAKRKSFAHQIDELLVKTSNEELNQFIRNSSSNNPQFRSDLLSYFAENNTYESKQDYVKQIKSILKSASGRDGYIQWRESRSVNNAINKLLNTADKHLNNHNFKTAFFISTAVMEEMTRALQFADDSNGDIGSCVDAAFEILLTIAKEQSSEDIRNLIIKYCITSIEKKIFSGWDWNIEVLNLASTIIKTEEETERLLDAIDNSQTSDYEKNEAHRLKYEILLKMRGEKAAEIYLEKNISSSKLRTIAIQNAMDKKNYEKAISIAKDGVNYDSKYPGLVLEWYDWLLKLAQAQHDFDKIIEYSRLLFISDFRNRRNYYKILKQNIKSEQWKEFVDNIIHEISSNSSWNEIDLIGEIYIWEKWWDRLLDLVKNSPGLELFTIDNYAKYLSKNYSNEIVELYKSAILKQMKNTTGRKDYQKLCIYIQKIINLGNITTAKEIISYFQAEYPKRKTLLDELNKIKIDT